MGSRTSPELDSAFRLAESRYHADKLRYLLLCSVVCNLLLLAAICGMVRGSATATTGAAHPFSTGAAK